MTPTPALSDKDLCAIADREGDIEEDGRGRITYSFDGYGLRRLADALIALDRARATAEPDRTHPMYERGFLEGWRDAKAHNAKPLGPYCWQECEEDGTPCFDEGTFSSDKNAFDYARPLYAEPVGATVAPSPARLTDDPDYFGIHCPACEYEFVTGALHDQNIEIKNLRAALAASGASPEPTAEALEFAEYMARGGEHLIECMNAFAKVQEQAAQPSDLDMGPTDQWVENAQQHVTEAMRGLRSDVYEFRKRRDRAALAVGTEIPQKHPDHQVESTGTPPSAATEA